MKIIQSHSNSPIYNLALEEYLFSEFQDDILLFYINDKSVIVGSNQSVRNEVNQEFCRANNIQIVRRKSGGGTVFQDTGNLNFSFINDKSVGVDSLSSNFLQPIAAWLNELGVEVTIGDRKDLWLPDGFKISGTASQIRKNRELHHGTLLVDANLDLLQQSLFVPTIDTMIKATLSVRSKTKNIVDYLSENKILFLSAKNFMDKLIAIAEKHFNTKKVDATYFDQPTIYQLQLNYQSDAWNFRK